MPAMLERCLGHSGRREWQPDHIWHCHQSVQRIGQVPDNIDLRNGECECTENAETAHDVQALLLERAQPAVSPKCDDSGIAVDADTAGEIVTMNWPPSMEV